ncbi:MAG: ATP-binding protein [Leptospiraceae bacterium]|nr:ATP-binding protein [Leptospiraceae bacterium]
MTRLFPQNLIKHWQNSEDLIQVIIGPRQVGKTTAILNLAKDGQTHYVTADLPTSPTADLILIEWEKAKKKLPEDGVIIFDEAQKIPRWSEVIKKIWDERIRTGGKQNCWILGSSALLLEKGLSESLTGRFELNHFPHWTFGEVEKVFQASLYDYVYWGGYPKIYSLKDDEERANDYLQNSIIETTLGRDILSLHSVDKPALLRQLFWYISRLPAQMVSFEKILGALQGKGNSATIVHYAELLRMAFVIVPIYKYSQAMHRTKKSIPKWIIPNPALVDVSIKEERLKNFTFENLVGSHLLNITFGKNEYELQYWNENGKEIDFILCKRGVPQWAFEVKSGRSKKMLSLQTLKERGINCPYLLINQDNVEKFLRINTEKDFNQLD